MPNSLLASVDSTQHFGDDNTIAIPMAVIEELQKFKGKFIVFYIFSKEYF